MRILKEPIYTEPGSCKHFIYAPHRYRHENLIYAYEPHFDCMVVVGSVSDKNKEVRPAHGYFKNHYHGYTTEKYAIRLGYKFIND